MASVTYTFVNGNIVEATEVNTNFQDLVDEFNTSTGHDHDGVNSKKLGPIIHQIYTGTAYDSVTSSFPSDVSNSYELTVVSAADISSIGANYVKIKVTGESDMNASSSNGLSFTAIKLEGKAVGGSYADLLPEIQKCKCSALASGLASNNADGSTTEYVHTLTSGEKSAGLQLKITSRSYTTRGAAEYDNKQVVVELLR